MLTCIFWSISVYLSLVSVAAIDQDIDCTSVRKLTLLKLRQNMNNPIYVPSCDDNGLFRSMQCNYLLGQCWCANVTSGMRIPGTLQKGFADCTGSPSNNDMKYEDESVCQLGSAVVLCSPLVCELDPCHTEQTDVVCMITPCALGNQCSVQYYDRNNTMVSCDFTSASRCSEQLRREVQSLRSNPWSYYQWLLQWLDRQDTAISDPDTPSANPQENPAPTLGLTECTATGEYKSQQCWGEFCWCVDPETGDTVTASPPGSNLSCAATTCANGKRFTPCRSACAHASCKNEDRYLECRADPCDDCAVTFYNSDGLQVQCADSDCTPVVTPSWMYDYISGDCTLVMGLKCVHGAVYSSWKECSQQNRGKQTIPSACEEPCAAASCYGYPTALCVSDRTECIAVFYDILTRSPVDCGKVVGRCTRYNSEIALAKQLGTTAGRIAACDEYGNYQPLQCFDDARRNCHCVHADGSPFGGQTNTAHEQLECEERRAHTLSGTMVLEFTYGITVEEYQLFSKSVSNAIATRLNVEEIHITVGKLIESVSIVEYTLVLIDTPIAHALLYVELLVEDIRSTDIHQTVGTSGWGLTEHQYSFLYNVIEVPVSNLTIAGFVMIILMVVVLSLLCLVGLPKEKDS